MPGKTVLYALLVSVAYFAATKVGLALTFPPYAVSALWPTNALLLAALLLAPPRLWGVLLLAAFPAHLAAELGGGVPLLMVLCWFVSNCTEALIGAVLIRRFAGGLPRFDRLPSVTVFVVSVVVATGVTSFLDAGFVALIGWGEKHYWDVWRMRCFSNLLAGLTVVPVIVAVAAGGVARSWRVSPARMLKAGLFAAGLLAAGLIAFESPSDQKGLIPALVYAPLPLLFWAAVRLGPSAVSGSLLATALLAIGGAIQGLGPFTGMSPDENVLSLQAFLVTMTVPLMFLAAAVQEHRETAQALRESQERLARTEAFSIVMVTHVGLDGRWLRVPPTLCELLGYSDEELLAGGFKDVTHPDDFEADWSQCERLIRGEIQAFDLEKRYIHRDGQLIWVDLNCSIVTDADGRPVHLLTFIKDITERKRAEAALHENEQALRESNERIRDLAGKLITAQEEERRRIARDLHDDLNQQVAAVAIGLSSLKRRLPAPADPLHDQLLTLQNRVSDIADRIRELSHELHSSALEHLGLSAALTALCEEFRDQRGIAIRLTMQGEITALPADVELCLYRVVQESLRNIAKHSGAACADVALTGNDTNVRLVVRDGGVGFDSDAARRGDGMGLVSMEERVRSLAGTFRVEARPGNGTELVAEIPLGRPSHE